MIGRCLNHEFNTIARVLTMPVKTPLSNIWLMGIMEGEFSFFGSKYVISSLKSSLDPKAIDPWIPYPTKGERVP
jgi:beta-lactamase regulating signal transducer with metallopeptidase domain